MSDNLSMIIAGLFAAITVCFVAVQVRGCNQDANKQVTELASQGIRADVNPDGKIRILDTRDIRPVEKESK